MRDAFRCQLKCCLRSDHSDVGGDPTSVVFSEPLNGGSLDE